MSFIKQFYADWPELLSNPLFIAGGSYGGIYAPNLAWAIHSHNQELNLTNATHESPKLPFNLKGFIVCNGATDWRKDPHVSAMDLFYHFSIIPLQLYRDYQSKDCVVQWLWFYKMNMKPLPPKDCKDMFDLGLSFVKQDIYDLRNI